MIAASLLTLAIVTQDQASLRAAPRDAAVQQAVLWQGDTLEIRGQRMDYLQVYDHRRERAGYIHISQVRTLSLKPADAPELLTVVRFLRETPGAEALGMGYTAAYLKAAPADAIGAEVFDALGTMAERLARRASMKHPKATSDVISAHTEVAAVYGVTFKGYEQGGAMQLCYTGDAFQRILALPVVNTVTLSAALDAEFRAHAALAVTRHDCMAADMHPQARLAHDKERIDLLDKVSPAQFAQLSEVSKNRLRLRRAAVSASLAFQQARRSEPPTAAAQRSLTELAAVNKAELTDNDLQEYNETAIRVGASRWAAETNTKPITAKLTVVTEPGQAGETCVSLFENTANSASNTAKSTKEPLIKRCTYGIVWAASASAHPNGQTLALAVQPLDTWRELWVFRKTAGQWAVDVLPPASSSPDLGYIEFAGWAQGAAQLLLARETKIAGRQKRSFEVLRTDTLITEKQASDSSLLVSFTKWQDAGWKRSTVSLR
jgi:hypothetical protein